MTGIERKISSDGTSASSLIQVAEHMLRNKTSLQEIFASLADVAEPLTPESLRKIIHAAWAVCRLLQRITRNEESPRSFCSKYMHFHCPAVPLFDDKVMKALPKLVRWQKSFQLFDLPNDADEYYAWYVLNSGNFTNRSSLPARPRPSSTSTNTFFGAGRAQNRRIGSIAEAASSYLPPTEAPPPPAANQNAGRLRAGASLFYNIWGERRSHAHDFAVFWYRNSHVLRRAARPLTFMRTRAIKTLPSPSTPLKSLKDDFQEGHWLWSWSGRPNIAPNCVRTGNWPKFTIG